MLKSQSQAPKCGYENTQYDAQETNFRVDRQVHARVHGTCCESTNMAVGGLERPVVSGPPQGPAIKGLNGAELTELSDISTSHVSGSFVVRPLLRDVQLERQDWRETESGSCAHGSLTKMRGKGMDKS